MYLRLFIYYYYYYYLDKNLEWVQMAVDMRITLRRARFGVNQSTGSCGFGDALEYTLDLFCFACLDFEYVKFLY
jgi:hypothetical protein